MRLAKCAGVPFDFSLSNKSDDWWALLLKSYIDFSVRYTAYSRISYLGINRLARRAKVPFSIFSRSTLSNFHPHALLIPMLFSRLGTPSVSTHSKCLVITQDDLRRQPEVCAMFKSKLRMQAKHAYENLLYQFRDCYTGVVFICIFLFFDFPRYP